MTSLLANLFSEGTLQKFERKERPEEFKSKQKESQAEVADHKLERNPKRKRKHDEGGEDIESLRFTQSNGQDEGNSQHTPFKKSEDTNTLFVGNVPIGQTVKSITRFFSKYGGVESVRLRSVPVSGTKVDEAGNQDLVRRVCVRKGLFGDQKGSLNAYVVFKEASSVENALVANNAVLDSRHIRCDRVPPTLFNPKTSVFIGNLPNYADEEQLREHFAPVLPSGQDDILGVRIVRDPDTLIGKGIAYMLFSSSECVLKALALHQSKFNKREIRVTSCHKSSATSKKSSKTNSNRERKFSGRVASDIVNYGVNAAKRIAKKVSLCFALLCSHNTFVE